MYYDLKVGLLSLVVGEVVGELFMVRFEGEGWRAGGMIRSYRGQWREACGRWTHGGESRSDAVGKGGQASCEVWRDRAGQRLNR